MACASASLMITHLMKLWTFTERIELESVKWCQVLFALMPQRRRDTGAVCVWMCVMCPRAHDAVVGLRPVHRLRHLSGVHLVVPDAVRHPGIRAATHAGVVDAHGHDAVQDAREIEADHRAPAGRSG